MPAQVGAGQKLDLLYKSADYFVIVNISVRTLSCHAIHAIFAFFCFQFLSNDNGFSLSLSNNFKDSNVFEFTNLPFKTKYNNMCHTRREQQLQEQFLGKYILVCPRNESDLGHTFSL